MTWISTHKPQRKIARVYAEPHSQPLRGSADAAGGCFPTLAKLDGGAESQPTHFPWPARAVCGAMGVPVCLEEPRPPAWLRVQPGLPKVELLDCSVWATPQAPAGCLLERPMSVNAQ